MEQFDKLPTALLTERRWLVWRLESRANKDGSVKVTKVPYRPFEPSRLASSTEPATWGTFAAACAVVRAGKADGIGFALGDGYVGIDIDHCRDAATNRIDGPAQNLIDEFNSYTEASPSGTGVHILLHGDLPGGCKAGGIEVYGAGRYFTMSGRRLGVADQLEARPELLAALVARLAPPPPPRKDGKPRKVRAPKAPAPPPVTLVTRTFPSSSSPGTTYTASFDRATRKGSCTCPGHKYRKFNRNCCHLVALGAQAPELDHTRAS